MSKKNRKTLQSCYASDPRKMLQNLLSHADYLQSFIRDYSTVLFLGSKSELYKELSQTYQLVSTLCSRLHGTNSN